MAYPSTDELGEAGLRLGIAAPLLTVTLDRPEVRNAQTPAMWRCLAAIGAAVPSDVRVVAVRGSGPSFSAGLDRAMMAADGVPGEASFADMAAMPSAECKQLIASYQAAFAWLGHEQFVSIAVVQGHAVGAGFQLALACDLRILADDARLCMREPALGLVPDLGGTKPLVELVGYSRALEICATSRWVDGDEALSIGLATAVVTPDAMDETLAAYVTSLTAANYGAVKDTKALLRDASERDSEEQRRAERTAQVRRLRALMSVRHP
ncbi:MAG: enoyl-CoA hydratase/isomerase family protein [Nocardioidaceae bacterium]